MIVEACVIPEHSGLRWATVEEDKFDHLIVRTGWSCDSKSAIKDILSTYSTKRSGTVLFVRSNFGSDSISDIEKLVESNHPKLKVAFKRNSKSRVILDAFREFSQLSPIDFASMIESVDYIENIQFWSGANETKVRRIGANFSSSRVASRADMRNNYRERKNIQVKLLSADNRSKSAYDNIILGL